MPVTTTEILESNTLTPLEPSTLPLVESKLASEDSETESLLYGHTHVDECFKELNDAMQQNNIEALGELYSKIRHAGLSAYENNNPALYAHIIQHIVDFLVDAFEKNQLGPIAIFAALTHEELRRLEKILSKKNPKLLTFACLDDENLEIFSELLKKDKKEIQPFKEAVYQHFADRGQDCRPSTTELTETIQAAQSWLQKNLETPFHKRSEWDMSEEVLWLDAGMLTHLFFTQQFQLFHHTVNAYVTVLENRLRASKANSSLSEILDVSYNSVPSLWTFNFLTYLIETKAVISPDLRPYLMLTEAQGFLDEFVFSNNVETKKLVEYQQQLKHIMATTEGPTEPVVKADLAKLLEGLQQALKSGDTQSIKAYGIKLVALSRSFFQDNHDLEFSQIILGISKIISTYLREEELGILQIMLGLHLDETHELQLIFEKKRLDLICYKVLNMLLYDSEEIFYCNATCKQIEEFGQNVIQHISAGLAAEQHVPLLRPLAAINEAAKHILTEKQASEEGSLQALQLICLEVKTQIHHAFIYKDASLYSSIVTHIVDVLCFAHSKGRLDLFFQASRIKLATLAGIADLLEKPDLLALHKIFIDYLLKEDIAEYSGKHNNRHSEVNITTYKVYSTRRQEEESFIAFQKAIYTQLGLSTELQNLGKIIVSPYEITSLLNLAMPAPVDATAVTAFNQHIATAKSASSFEQYKTLGSNGRKYLKNAFETNNTGEFARILSELVSLMSKATEQGRMDKVAQLLHELTSRTGLVSPQQKTFLNENSALVLVLFKIKSDTPQAAALLNFILVDLLDFAAEFSRFDANKQKMIAAFKGEVIEALNRDNPAAIPNQKEMAECIDTIKDPITIHYCLNGYLRYGLLSYHNHPTHTRLRFLGDILLSSIGKSKSSAKRTLVDLIYAFYGAKNAVPAMHLMEALSHQEAPALLAWSLLNATDQMSLDNMAKQNGLSLEAINQCKVALSLFLGIKLDVAELLKDYTELKPMLEIREGSELTVEDKQKLTFTLLQVTCLLMDQVRTLDAKAFAKTLLAFMKDLKNSPRLLEVFSQCFLTRIEQRFDFVCMVNQGDIRLLARYFIELINKDSTSDNIPAVSLYNFVKETVHEIARITPNTEKVDINSAKNLGLLLDQDARQEHTHLQYALGLEIRDAYCFDNPKRFAELMKELTCLLQTLFVQGKHLALIQVLELNARKSGNDLCAKQYVKLAEPGLATKVSLEDIYHSLTVNNVNGVTKLLIDAFLDKSCLCVIGKITDSTKFKQAVYEALDIIPLDLYKPGTLNTDKEIDFVTASIRTLANRDGVDLTKYKNTFEAFAKLRPIVTGLPKPEPTDTDHYRAIYAAMHTTWQNHLLAHRFGITGKLLEGSFSITMMQELKAAYETFLKSSNKEAAFLAAKAIAFQDMPQEEWEKACSQIKTDVNQIILKPQDVDEPSKIKTDQTIAMPLFLDCGDTEGHLTSIIFFKFRNQDYCILTDKSLMITKSSGLEIKIVNHPEQIPLAISAIARAYIANAMESGVTPCQLKIILQPLGLELSKTLAKKPQKSGNCGWSSSAKLCAFSLIFINMLKGLETKACTIDEAIELARQAAMLIYKPFTLEDRNICLANYLAYCRQGNSAPHAAMMAQIFLKNEQHPDRKGIMDHLGAVQISDADKASARAALLKSTIEFLLYTSKIKDPNTVSRKQVLKLATPLLDAYLKHQPSNEFDALLAAAVKELQENRELRKAEDADEDTLIQAQVKAEHVIQISPVDSVAQPVESKAQQEQAEHKGQEEASILAVADVTATLSLQLLPTDNTRLPGDGASVVDNADPRTDEAAPVIFIGPSSPRTRSKPEQPPKEEQQTAASEHTEPNTSTSKAAEPSAQQDSEPLRIVL